MINAIAELGRYAKQQNPELTDFDIWVEDSFDGGKYDIVFFIVLSQKNESSHWEYQEIDIWENSSDLKNKLIYKRGSPRGTDKTPTAKVAKSISGTFRQKIKNWFEVNKDAAFLEDQEKKILSRVNDSLSENEDKIISDLEEQQDLSDAKGIVISIKFIEDNKSKFPGDYNSISNFILQESKTAYKYSKTYKVCSFSKNKVCSVCNEEKSEVFGYFNSLGFYTVDKPGMVTGGFQQAQSWKNYPVCLKCALDLETGIRLKEEKLDFRFYGFRYYLIPKIIHGSGIPDIIEEILSLEKEQKINNKKKYAMRNPEEDVLYQLKKHQNNVHFNLLFYDKPNKGVFRIIENIEEVLPSRIRLLYETKDYVEGIFLFKLPKKDGKRIFSFNFGMLRNFFPRDKMHGNHDKHFLQIVRQIFTGLPIKYHFVLTHIMASIRSRFVNEESDWFQTLSSFMLLNYFQKLGILDSFKGEDHMTMEFYSSFEIKDTDDYEDKVDEFFENFSEFFTTSDKRGIFLTGVLTNLLLNTQLNERGAMPFRKRLKGLKMDGSDIVGLFPQVLEKLDQYGNHAYKQLEILISKFFVDAGDHANWNMTIDEMNYIFVLGMNLSQYFKIITP